MVTRADVARYAGTSTAVVSYVVNNGPRPVAEATRLRVLKAIEALNYRPNRIAQALRGSRSRVLGLLVPDIANPFFAELARAVERAAEAAGYALLLGNGGDGAEHELRYIRAFLDQQVDGLMLASGSPSQHVRRLAAEIAIPFVLIDRRLNVTANTCLIATDNVWGGRLATEHLIALGHERIAALCGPVRLGGDRKAGYTEAMLRAGLVPHAVHAEAFDREATYSGALRILRRRSRPSAIFATSEIAAASALRAAADLGLSVPGDVALVSYDDTQASTYTVPRLTSIAQPIAEIGDAAVAYLHRASREDAGREPAMRLFRPRLVVRESCGASLSRDSRIAAAQS